MCRRRSRTRGRCCRLLTACVARESTILRVLTTARVERSRSTVEPKHNGGRDGDSRVPEWRGLSRGDRPDHRRVEPGLAGAGRAPRRARRTCCSSSSTTPASASSAATAARSRRRTSTRSRPTGCATTTCTPRRSARRAAPASSPGATTTATAWPASPSSPPATPATTASSPSRTACSRRCCCEHGYNTYMVGKWHLTPSNQETAAGPYDRWPLGRGFERFYGFLGGDTSQWYPELVYDNHQVEPPADARRRATTSPRTWSTRRSSSSPTPSRSTPTSRSSCTSASAPCTRRTTCPRSGPTSTRASSTTAGTPTARRSSPARRSSASSRPTPSCRATIPTCPTGTRCSADERKLYARMMEVFAGFLEHTDHHIGRLLDFLKRIEASSTTP